MEKILQTGLFADWKEPMILSALQGVMGSVYGNEDSAMAAAVDFCFYAGKPDAQLIAFWPKECKRNLRLLIPQNEQWQAAMEQTLGEGLKKVSRYCMEKTPEKFDRAYLQQLADSLPEGYTYRSFDKALYEQILQEQWGKSLVASYDDYSHFERMGKGLAVMCGEKMAAGISSYCSFNGGYELEINTHDDFRRKGLGIACAAKFILECLELGLYPNWDAANESSLRMAQKLGYILDKEYVAYIQYR